MEMSLGYLKETIAHLNEKGFQTTEDPIENDNYSGVRFSISRRNVAIEIEYLLYPDAERYWLHVVNFHGLTTMPFEIDSWKFRDEKTEFRYYAKNDGTALTFSIIYSDLTD